MFHDSLITIQGYQIRFLSEHYEGGFLETLLKNRGLSGDDAFFRPSFSHLLDPFLFPDMEKAVDRITLAKNEKQRVVVFGDYDVDGIASTAMLVRFFHMQDMAVSYRLPHRVHDGYGLKRHFIDDLKSQDVKLLITVDCGTRDLDVIDYARTRGMDVIITDHHVVPERYPTNVVAFLNPRLAGTYPFESLAGSGVAFKLLSALAMRWFPLEFADIMLSFIDFAALGTIADCMPLVGENRVIASLGLTQMKHSHSDGLRRLVEGKGMRGKDSDIVSFFLAPRLNAAGRMDSPYKALQVLLASEDRLDPLFTELESLNVQRKTSTEHFVLDALSTIDTSGSVLYYDSTSINHGILGLIAGRLSEAYHKPAIALREEKGVLVGSCRSPEYCPIAAIFETLRDSFLAFGGHDQAAGFTIKKENFSHFREQFSALVSAHVETVSKDRFHTIDFMLPFSEIRPDNLFSLDQLLPCGIGNKKPLFYLSWFPGNTVEYLGKDQKHVRFHSSKKGIKIVGFNFGHLFGRIRDAKTLGFVYELDRDSFGGTESIIVRIKDIIIDDGR